MHIEQRSPPNNDRKKCSCSDGYSTTSSGCSLNSEHIFVQPSLRCPANRPYSSSQWHHYPQHPMCNCYNNRPRSNNKSEFQRNLPEQSNLRINKSTSTNRFMETKIRISQMKSVKTAMEPPPMSKKTVANSKMLENILGEKGNQGNRAKFLVAQTHPKKKNSEIKVGRMLRTNSLNYSVHRNRSDVKCKEIKLPEVAKPKLVAIETSRIELKPSKVPASVPVVGPVKEPVKEKIKKSPIQPSQTPPVPTKPPAIPTKPPKVLSPPPPPPSIPAAPPLPSLAGGTISLREISIAVNSDPCLPWKKLEDDKLSGTIFEKCQNSLVHDSTFKSVLKTDNDQIKQLASSKCYNPFGESGKFFARVKNSGCLDRKKAYNLAIIAGGIKKPIKEIVEAFCSYDTSLITAEVLRHLLLYGPDEHERKCLMKVKNEDELELPDKLALALIKIPEYDNRLRSMLLQATFSEKCSDVVIQLSHISNACNSLMNSASIKELIELLLNLGNYLNKDNPKYGKAKGFDIELLSRIAETRVHSKKTSALNLLVKLSNRKFQCRKSLQRESASLKKAALIDIKEIDESVGLLKENIQICQIVTKSLQTNKNSRFDEIYLQTLSDFVKKASEELIRLKQQVCQVKSEIANVKRYFGFNNKDDKAEIFFQTFRDFIDNFLSQPVETKESGFAKYKRGK